MVAAIIVLAIFSGSLLTYLMIYKKQMNTLTKQIDFIQLNETNQHLNLFLQTNEFRKLAKNVNAVLAHARDEKVSLYKAERAFKQAITNVSHDLRTPLTSVVGYIEMVESGQLTNVERNEYYQVVKGRVRHLVQMLDNLFEFARIESGEYAIKPEKIDVGQIFLETIYLFQYDFAEKKTEPKLVLPDTSLYIIGDPDVLKRIFENAIRNALSHGEGDLTVNIEEEADKAVIELQNDAPELTDQDIQNLFERFYTSDSSRHRKTTGLGLSIASRLVAMMNGEIKAEKRGGTFCLIIQFDLANPLS